MASRKEALKSLLGELPLTVEMYWLLRQRNKPFVSHYNLDKLREVLEGACQQAYAAAPFPPDGKKVFLFATLHYWVEQTTLMGLALRGLGHDVTLMYLPYSNFRR